MDLCVKCLAPIIAGVRKFSDKMACSVKISNLVEPIIFVYMLIMYLQFPGVQALIYLKVCALNFNETVCHLLSNATYKDEELKVQRDTSHWIMYLNLALLLPSIFSAMVLGRIGDTVSRKWTILLPIIGQFLCGISNLVNAHYVHISLGYLLIGPLLSGMFGGFTSLIMGIYSYLSNATEVKSRIIRMGILESMTFFAGTLGVLLVGVILDNFGFVVVFGIIFALGSIILLYTIFVLEDLTPETDSAKQRSFCSFMEAYRNYIEFFHTPREGNKNRILLLGTLIICLLLFMTAGEIELTFLYLSHPPTSFSKSYISYYLAWDNCMKALPLITLLPLFKKWFSINDCFWGVLGIVSKSIGCVIFGSVHSVWIIFCVPVVRMFQGFPSAVIRSLLSTAVEDNEQGQMFAVVASAESIVTMLAALTLNNLYSATVSINPGISFYFSAGVGLIAILFVCLTWKISANTSKYEHFVDITENTEEPNEIANT